MKRQIKIGAITNALLIKYMQEGVYTCADLAEMTGLHYKTVLHYTRELYLAGAAHITRWANDTRGREVVKVYALGQGKDKQRVSFTVAECSARYRSKLNQRMASTPVAT